MRSIPASIRLVKIATCRALTLAAAKSLPGTGASAGPIRAMRGRGVNLAWVAIGRAFSYRNALGGRDDRGHISYGCGCSSGVEHDLAKVGVEGSNPFARSSFKGFSQLSLRKSFTKYAKSDRSMSLATTAGQAVRP